MTRHCNFCYQEASTCPALQERVMMPEEVTVLKSHAREILCNVTQHNALEKHTNEVPQLD